MPVRVKNLSKDAAVRIWTSSDAFDKSSGTVDNTGIFDKNRDIIIQEVETYCTEDLADAAGLLILGYANPGANDDEYVDEYAIPLITDNIGDMSVCGVGSGVPFRLPAGKLLTAGNTTSSGVGEWWLVIRWVYADTSLNMPAFV